MKRFFTGLIVGFALIAAAYFGASFFLENSPVEEKPSATPSIAVSEKPKEKEVEKRKTIDFLLLVKDVEKDGKWEEVYLYSDNSLEKLSPPENADYSKVPVTDGKRIYYLTKENKGATKLVSVSIDGEDKLISDSTPLVHPGVVSTSNDGKTVVFRLDSNNGKSTELWTYDAAKDRKRVSLEMLASGFMGPFWDENGGFLVKNNNQILSGSPNRTGADILPIENQDWKQLLPGHSLIPSPGGTQAVYLLKSKTGSDLFVSDAKTSETRKVHSFETDKATILGWNSEGSLVVTTLDVVNKVWNIAKDFKDSFSLPINSFSPSLSGDGNYLGYITSSATGEKIFIVKAADGAVVGEHVLPVPELTEITSSADDMRPAMFEIIQYLRPETDVDVVTASAEAVLADEEIVRYVMENISVIADAPQGEPATATRVWFTGTQGAVYVDYIVGTTTWRRLVQIDGIGAKATRHSVLGIFAPVDGEWVLAKGKNLKDTETTTQYEFEQSLQKWIKWGI